MVPTGTDVEMEGRALRIWISTQTTAGEQQCQAKKLNIKARDATEEEGEQRHAKLFHGKEEPRKKKIVFSFCMLTAWCQAKNGDYNVMMNANYELRTASRINGGPPQPKAIVAKQGRQTQRFKCTPARAA